RLQFPQQANFFAGLLPLGGFADLKARRQKLIVPLLSLALARPAISATRSLYTVESMGSIGGKPLVGQCINDYGKVAAILWSDPHRAYVWSNGVPTPVSNPGFDFSRMRAINNAGIGVGSWANSKQDVGGGAIWSSTGDFSQLGGTNASFFP